MSQEELSPSPTDTPSRRRVVAFEIGEKAWESGMLIDENPFPLASDAWLGFREGYLAAASTDGA